ncbi:MAG: glycosyltransferase family 1 protein [Eubacteriales bacterium]
MPKSKIYIDTQPIFKKRTGIVCYTYNNILETLKAAPEDIDIYGVVYDFLGRLNAESELRKIGFKSSISKKNIPPRLYKLIWEYIKIRFDNHFKDGDIYHFYNYVIPPIGKDKKVIINVYDMVYKKFPETMKNSNLYLLERDLGRSINRADHIITISESSKKDIQQYFDVDDEKISVILPGIDLEFFSQGKNIDSKTENAIKGKYNLPEKYLLYLGTIEPRKNIKTIFDAYAALPKKIKEEYMLVIAGDRGWKSAKAVEYPKKLGIEKHIKYIGYVSEEDKPLIYGMAEVFLFPSLYEGFGMPVSEALACGTPVITSDNSALPEAGGEGASYIQCMDYGAMAAEIERYIEDADYKEKKLSLGMQHLQRLSWRDNGIKSIEIYKGMGE